MGRRKWDQSAEDPEGFWEDSIGRALDALVSRRGLAKAAAVLGLTEVECAERLEKNCGSGDEGNPGFQAGNRCAAGGAASGRTDAERASVAASGVGTLDAERTRAPKDLAGMLTDAQRARGVSVVASKLNDDDALGLVHADVYARLGGFKGQTESVQIGDRGGRYHERVYAYERGRVAVRRDENSVEVHLFGVGEDGRERDLGKFKMRDRRFDGTPAANESPLTDWSYDAALDAGGEGAVEFSIYARDAGSFWTDAHPGEDEFEDFLRDPFYHMTAGWDATKLTDAARADFMEKWQRAFDAAATPFQSGGERSFDARFPAQNSLPSKGAGAAFNERGERLAAAAGFSRVDNVPSWYNVAKFLEKHGYEYKDSEDAVRMEAVKQALEKRGGLSKQQEAWLVLLQYAEEYGYKLPPDKSLGGAKMPLALGHNLWMTKGLKK